MKCQLNIQVMDMESLLQDYPVGHIRVMNLDAIKYLLKNQNFEIIKNVGATFERFNGVLHFVDLIMSKIVSLSSNFVIHARNKKGNNTDDKFNRVTS